ncbi:MAG TPA: alpha/beta hydrolase [Candidatus Baltobacteraceae bacterium]|jgi:acetyl esterase/lipase
MLRSLALVALCLLCSGTSPRLPEQTTGIAYAPDGSDVHRLDLYLPAERAGAPLIVFAHGGAFMYGDRRDDVDVGRALSRAGMAVAIPSYRLFPQTDAQGSTRDVALAIAWMLAHARDYGIDPTSTFLVGHSAGAQIVAMIGTHLEYLREAGASPRDIRGVFALAGAYDVRDLSDEPDSWKRVDGHIYGETADDRARISPALTVDPASPPVEAVCGTADDAGSCPRTISFVRALRAAGVESQAFREIGADHMGVLRAFLDPHDPLGAEFRTFVAAHR